MPASDTSPQAGFEPRIGRSVSLDHAADLLGVSRRTIYNRIREGRLQTIRTLGGSQRVLVESVEDLRRHSATILAFLILAIVVAAPVFAQSAQSARARE